MNDAQSSWFPICYEPLTADPTGSKAFYDGVIGGAVADKSGQPGRDYLMIAVGGGDFAGGMLSLTQEMQANGAKPTWGFYIGVDDVDATAAKIKAKGGSTHMAPFNIPRRRRAAMVADPQDNRFYIVRGASAAASSAFDRTALGKCLGTSWRRPIRQPVTHFTPRCLTGPIPTDRRARHRAKGAIVLRFGKTPTFAEVQTTPRLIWLLSLRIRPRLGLVEPLGEPTCLVHGQMIHRGGRCRVTQNFLSTLRTASTSATRKTRSRPTSRRMDQRHVGNTQTEICRNYWFDRPEQRR